MQSAARLAANRLNAQYSTGAKTPEGKAKSAQNATKFGLYKTAIVVRPEEKEEFETLVADLQSEFAPATATEQTFATLALNAAWRIRRCDRIEANLTAKAHENGLDPLVDQGADPATAATLHSIDRARSQAIATHRRSIAELCRLQTNRRLRDELFPEGNAPLDLGLADHRSILCALRRAEGRTPSPTLQDFQDLIDKTNPTPGARSAGPLTAEFAKRTQQTPRNAPCPCRSGQKFKRCCGRNAPAAPGKAA
jgi:hypothetical protein